MPCIHDFMSDIILMNSTLYTCNALVCMRLNFRKGTLLPQNNFDQMLTFNHSPLNSKGQGCTIGYLITVLTYQNKSDKQQ